MWSRDGRKNRRCNANQMLVVICHLLAFTKGNQTALLGGSHLLLAEETWSAFCLTFWTLNDLYSDSFCEEKRLVIEILQHYFHCCRVSLIACKHTSTLALLARWRLPFIRVFYIRAFCFFYHCVSHIMKKHCAVQWSLSDWVIFSLWQVMLWENTGFCLWYCWLEAQCFWIGFL